jgi:glycosyltransferase involved in cell wall biosynthesis
MTSSLPLDDLSVLVTCFNKVKYVSDCFRALIELERLGASVIIIDDGSTDGSSELLKKLGSDPELAIQIIRTENHGAGPARTLSIEKSETSYIFFLDIDDLPLTEGIQELFATFKSSQADLAVGNYEIIQNGEIGSMPLNVKQFQEVSLQENQQNFKNAMGWWRYIYKREFLLEPHNMIGKAFEEFGDKRFVLDDLFWMNHLCSQDLTVLVSPKSLLVYAYNLPLENAKQSWDSYLKQVSYLSEATWKYFNFLMVNNCDHQVDWMVETALTDGWNHMPLLPLTTYYRSYFANLKLTLDFLGGTPKAYLKGWLYLIFAVLKRFMRIYRELKSH